MAEKTHKPTHKRLQDARKKGDVVFSGDIASTLSYVLILAALWLLGGGAFSALRELWLHATSPDLFIHPREHVQALLRHTSAVLLWGMLSLAGVAALGGIAGSFFQVGGLAAFQRLKPDMNRLSPAEGLKRVFSTRSLIELLKMVAKTVLLALLMFVVVRGFVATALKLGYAHPFTTMAVAGRVLLMTFAWAAVIYAVMAAVDYVHKRHEFIKQMRMSIDDLRNEHKEQEGDPINSSRRRSEHFQAVYSSLADRVRLSSAVIHSARAAVALQYRGPDDLPRVMARGENEIAAQIRRVAGDALIPMAFDPHLAERLYAEVPQDMAIPRPLYEPVARLLRWAQGKD
jgi:type III secretion protein U